MALTPDDPFAGASARGGAVPSGMYGWVDIKAVPLDALVDDSGSALAGRASVGSSLDAPRSLVPDAGACPADRWTRAVPQYR